MELITKWLRCPSNTEYFSKSFVSFYSNQTGMNTKYIIWWSFMVSVVLGDKTLYVDKLKENVAT